MPGGMSPGVEGLNFFMEGSKMFFVEKKGGITI